MSRHAKYPNLVMADTIYNYTPFLDIIGTRFSSFFAQTKTTIAVGDPPRTATGIKGTSLFSILNVNNDAFSVYIEEGISAIRTPESS